MVVPVLSYLESYHMLGCINQIIRHSIEINTDIIQITGNLELDFPVIRKSYREKYVLTNELQNNLNFHVVDLDELPMKELLKAFGEDVHFKPRIRYLFVGKHFSDSDLKELLLRFVVNAVFLNTSNLEIYTYFPYEFGNIQDVSTLLRQIGRCDPEFKLKESYHSLFPNKNPTSWKNSTISLIFRNHQAPYTTDISGKVKGIENEILELILASTGISGRFSPETQITNITAGFVDLSRIKFDIIFGMVGPQVIAPLCESTIAITSDPQVWIVPIPDKLPKWKFAIKAFSEGVWINLICSLTSAMVFWYIVNVIFKTRVHGNVFLEKFYLIVRIVLEQCITFKFGFICQVIIHISIIQAIFVLNALYKAKYYFFLTGNFYESSIDSLEDIMEHNLQMGIGKEMITYFDHSPSVKEYVNRKAVFCDTRPICLNQAAKFKNMAVAKRFRKFSFTRYSSSDDQEYPLREIKEQLNVLWNSFLVTRGHPMYHLVNRYLQYLIDHGFLTKILRKSDNRFSKTETNRMGGHVRFGMDYVKAPFCIIVIGSFAGSLIFVIECLLRKFQQ